jgi:hypothetical protein
LIASIFSDIISEFV